ncbi:uncharacterized protein [Venturia canescens]|uniref:uncharacterized protein n=1 Tax=Venturia canescens TaxID=32260 RepID=UPI001C9C909E|nr:uncharacterized protein LOC122407001 [Venturia canescens]
MQLIREKELSHDAFWRDMRKIFDKCSKKFTSGQPLLHWDLILHDDNFDEIIMEEEMKDLPKGPETSQGNIIRSRADSKLREKRTWNQNRSRQSMKSLIKSKTDKLVNENSDENSNQKPEIFDVVKEATYNMYGDRFHYTLIVMTFVEPIPLIDYKLPNEFQVPRPIKMFDPETSEKEEIAPAPAPRKSKDIKKNKKDEKKNSHSRDTKNADIRRSSDTHR